MAITNAQIIFAQSQELLKEGKIKPTGRTLEFELEDGTVLQYPEAEPIHTFQMWKSLGFSVKKGEKAVAKFTIWKYTVKKKTESEEEAQQKGHCFMKDSCFFSLSQVEKAS